jgi:hypothetical protein
MAARWQRLTWRDWRRCSSRRCQTQQSAMSRTQSTIHVPLREFHPSEAIEDSRTQFALSQHSRGRSWEQRLLNLRRLRQLQLQNRARRRQRNRRSGSRREVNSRALAVHLSRSLGFLIDFLRFMQFTDALSGADRFRFRLVDWPSQSRSPAAPSALARTRDEQTRRTIRGS